MFTATRILVAVVVFVAFGGMLVILPGLLLDPVGPALMASPSPSVSASPAPTPSPQPTITPPPTLKPLVSSAESTFAATQVLAELEPGADPTSLGLGSLQTAVFVDRAAGRVYEVARDGYLRTIAGEGDLGGREQVGVPRLAVRGGRDIVFFDDDGRGWRWVELSSPGALSPLVSEADGPGAAQDVTRIDPATQAFASVTHGRREYDVYLADPGSADVVRHVMRLDTNEALGEVEQRLERPGRGEVVGLYADPTIYVLADGGVEHWVDGRRVEGFRLQPPPGNEPDYRYISGIGSDGKGQLWLFDAVGQRVIAFDKSDGGYLGSWGTAADGPPMIDVRGMFVEGDGTGSVATVTWLTPGGVMRSAISDASAVMSERSARTGRLVPSTREPGDRPVDWGAKGVRMQADDVRLRIGGKKFKAGGEVLTEADVGERQTDLANYWYDDKTQMRLLVFMVADDSHWWVSEIWTYDGVRGDGDWIFFEGLAPLTRTPLGEALEGDLRVTSTGAERRKFQKDASASLRINGLRLTAFEPRSQPAPLTGCEHIEHPELSGQGYPGDLLQGRGEPLEGVRKMNPAKAEARLQELGLCYRFDYRYKLPKRFKDERLNAHLNWGGERRCSAPEHGRIGGLRFSRDFPYDESAGLIVVVSVVDRNVRDLPEPPPQGTDCPSR